MNQAALLVACEDISRGPGEQVAKPVVGFAFFLSPGVLKISLSEKQLSSYYSLIFLS